MRAIVYTRQSLDRNGEGSAVARQLEDARKLARLRGWEIVGVHEDNDVSAAAGKPRPGFEATLHDLANGRAGAVIAWNLDRLTRNRRDTVRLIETCQQAGAVIAVVRGSDLDMSTPAGRMTADILAAVARSEIETKGDRQRRSNQQAAEQGRPPRGGRRAFGYTADGLDVIESEAAMIRRAHDLILAGGSLSSVAREWNADGVTTTAGGQWNASSVRRVLESPRYAALRLYRGEIVGPGTWPAIVGEDVYRATAALLADPARSTVRDRAIKYPLTRLATCGRCGGKLATGRTSAGVRTYACQGRRDMAVSAQPIDDYVIGTVLARLARPDAADLVKPSPMVDVAELRTRANALRARLDEGARLFAAGVITGRQLARITADASDALEVVNAEIARAGDRDVLARFVGVDDVRAVWDGLDILAQRAIIGTVFASIVIEAPGQGGRFRPELVKLTWRQ